MRIIKDIFGNLAFILLLLFVVNLFNKDFAQLIMPLIIAGGSLLILNKLFIVKSNDKLNKFEIPLLVIFSFIAAGSLFIKTTGILKYFVLTLSIITGLLLVLLYSNPKPISFHISNQKLLSFILSIAILLVILGYKVLGSIALITIYLFLPGYFVSKLIINKLILLERLSLSFALSLIFMSIQGFYFDLLNIPLNRITLTIIPIVLILFMRKKLKYSKKIKISYQGIAINVLYLIIFIAFFSLFIKEDFMMFTSPDENTNVNYGVYGSPTNLKFTFEENTDSNLYRIASRGSAVNYNYDVVATKFLGYPFIISAFSKVIPNQLDIIILFGVLLLFTATGILYNEISHNKQGISFLLLSIISMTSVLYYFYKGFYEDILVSGLIILGYVYFLRHNVFNGRYRLIYYPLFALSFFIKPLFLIYMLPAAIYELHKIKVRQIHKIILPGFLFLLIITPFFYHNYTLYGSPIRTGPATMHTGDKFIVVSSSTADGRLDNLIDSSKRYFSMLPYVPIALLLVLLSIRKKWLIKSSFLLSFVLMFIYLFMFSGAKNFTSFSSSVFRYTIFLQLFSLIFIIKETLDMKILSLRLKGIILIVLVLFSALALALPDNELVKISKLRIENRKIQHDLFDFMEEMNYTSENFVLITDGFDKIFFPEIKTAVIHTKYSKKINQLHEYGLSVCEAVLQYKDYDIAVYGYQNLLTESELNCLSQYYLIEEYDTDYKFRLFYLK